MKKNLILTFAAAAALMATSCDQNNTTTGTEANAAAEAPATNTEATVVDNPNVTSADVNATTTAATTNANAPVMTFEQTEYDFGKIKQGEVVNHTFKFTNTGKEPLVIENASASCGCTVPEWTRTPVAPGQTGEIKVEFNSTGKYGQQAPVVTIRANTEPNIVRVSMKGEVEANAIPTAGPEGPVKRN